MIGWNASRADFPLPAVDQAGIDHAIALIHSKIGAASYAESYRKGYSMSLNDAVAMALAGE